MPNSRLLWRALAWLGALLFIGSMWPIICAARPFPTYQHFALSWNRSDAIVPATQPTTTTTNYDSHRSNRMILNLTITTANSSDEINQTNPESASNQPVVFSSRIEHPTMMKSHGPHIPYDTKRVTIKSIFRRNQTRMHSHLNNRSGNVSDKRNRLIATVHGALTTKPSIATSSSTLHADADQINMTTESELNIDSMSFAVENLAASAHTLSVPVTTAPTPSSTPTSERTSTTTAEEVIPTSSEFRNPDRNDDDSTYSNATVSATFATPKYILNKRTTKRTKIQSVFLDYRNAINLPIENLINLTTKRLNEADERDKNDASLATMSTTIPPTTVTPYASITMGNKRKRQRLKNDSNLERNERSANLSLAKTSKRIQLLVKSRLLQILPDGTINGTQNDESDYTILQRGTVDVGQIRLQGVATCLYLCMDACGNLYGAKEFTVNCVFNERLLDNYNYYTSTHHSSAIKTFYLALNRLGVPRKTYIPSNKPLGKLSSYVKSITLNVPDPKSEIVLARLFGTNHIKHGLKHLCSSNKAIHELTTKNLVVPICAGEKTTPVTVKTLRHKRPPPAPAALIEQRGHRRPSAKCTHEPCTKKKRKITEDITATTSAPDMRTLMRRAETKNTTNRATSPKQKKKVKHKHKSRKHSPTAATTMAGTKSTSTSTIASISVYENLISDDNDDDDGGNADSIPSTGPTAINGDVDYEYGYDN